MKDENARAVAARCHTPPPVLPGRGARTARVRNAGWIEGAGNYSGCQALSRNTPPRPAMRVPSGSVATRPCSFLAASPVPVPDALAAGIAVAVAVAVGVVVAVNEPHPLKDGREFLM